MKYFVDSNVLLRQYYLTAQADTRTEDRQMNTQELYYALQDNDIDFDMDSVGDAESVWIQAIFENEEDFGETVADYLAEMPKRDLAEVGRKLAAGYKDVTQIVGGHIGNSTLLTACWAGSVSQSFFRAASVMALNHAKQITKLVESNSDQWMADCIGYHFDMQEGAKEDAAEFRADR
jgi:hypothetical protein